MSKIKTQEMIGLLSHIDLYELLDLFSPSLRLNKFRSFHSQIPINFDKNFATLKNIPTFALY